MKRILCIFLVLLLAETSLFAQATRSRCEPLAGERIDQMLTRNGLDVALYSPLFIVINKKKLGAGDQLLMNVSYELPTPDDLRNRDALLGVSPNPAPSAQAPAQSAEAVSSKPKATSVNAPILGKANETVQIVDSELRGATFYLVSGHGGPDPGALAEYGGKTISEDEYAYDIILRLARQLLSHDARVHVIIRDPDDGIREDAVLACDDHETCMGATIPLDQIQRLRQRADTINSLYDKERKSSSYVRSIFIHVDSRSKDERIDIFFYHFMKSKKGLRLAETLQRTMAEKYNKHQPNRGFSGTVSDRNLFVLRETNPVGVFLELGNIQNKLDIQRFVVPNNREAVARWICEGIIADKKSEQQ